jgi:mRNA interferase RelE/StbE
LKQSETINKVAYHLNFSKKAFKELEKIKPPFYANIKAAIYNLSENPRPSGYKKLTNIEGYRIRVGDYRIIYDIIDDQLLVTIITLGHRKDIYR